MKNHPAKTMTIYDIPGIVVQTLPLAATPTNIMSGFRVSGIFPFNRNIFQPEEFAPNSVTDRPNSDANQDILPATIGPIHESAGLPISATETSDVAPVSQVQMTSFASCIGSVSPNGNQNSTVTSETQTPSTSFADAELPSGSGISSQISSKKYCRSPEDFRPFPKAGPRLERNNCRKRKSEILTDTPHPLKQH